MSSVELNNKCEKYIKLLKFHLNSNGLFDWDIRISKAFKTLGSCNHTKKIISLSIHHVGNSAEADILNTILHEIAHALTPGDHHGKEWKKKALELGCDGKRCGEGIKIKSKYNFVCEKGCMCSYTKKCKLVDSLIAGKYRCKQHKLILTILNE